MSSELFRVVEGEIQLTQGTMPGTTSANTAINGRRADATGVRHDATPCDMRGHNRLPKPPQMTAANVLTPQQQMAISLFVLGRSAGSIAATLGVHRSTIARWRHQQPLFAAELARQQRDVYDTASRRLRLLMVKSIRVIDAMLASPRQQQEAAWKVLTGLRAAQWVVQPPPTNAEVHEWTEEPIPVAPSATPPEACQPPVADVISPGAVG